ncbi:MAG: SLC13 family permease [Gammaproteobacteria bacterium]|nr:MAG: SLC13 family permease [Gammaproteobacteria bacterium]
MAEGLALSTEMVVVLGLLGITVLVFAFDLLRVDITAISVMVFIGLAPYFPGIDPILSNEELFSGFASNAVIAIIAVMIIGAGLDKTGLMGQIAQLILKRGGNGERSIQLAITTTVATISSFMQNIGVAALFLPVISRISSRTGIPIGRMLMPMAFCALLGGTATMIGSSPLIILNDLIIQSNRTLPEAARMDTFGLFAVLPIGAALSITGILYFMLLGRFVLPESKEGEQSRTSRASDYFEQLYGIKGELFEARVTDDSPQVGLSLRQVEATYNDTPAILALYSGDVVKIPPDPDEALWVNSTVGLMGEREEIERFCEENHWELKGDPDRFAVVLDGQHSGIGEIVVPPSSSLVGKPISEIKPRRNYGTNILQIYRDHEIIRRHFGDVTLHAGDTLVVHASWKDLHAISKGRDFVVASEVHYENLRQHKVRDALLWYVLSLVLFLFTDNLAISLLTGALGMVYSGVLTMDEAYSAVSWSTVFLLASLIPLGVAVQQTGAAAWIAQEILLLIGDVPVWVLQAVIALLATFFSLVMSNVGATVLLVPLAINMAVAVGGNPAVFALTVAISTNNSFLIPTNQVNALVMGPGGYSVADFMRAGSIMTVLFLVVSLMTMNLIY